MVYRYCRHTAAYTPASLALKEAIDQSRPTDAIVVTGYLYLVGDAMRALGVGPPD
jgi:folylpolyglutamate synthase/dihydropteroate synthase